MINYTEEQIKVFIESRDLSYFIENILKLQLTQNQTDVLKTIVDNKRGEIEFESVEERDLILGIFSVHYMLHNSYKHIALFSKKLNKKIVCKLKEFLTSKLIPCKIIATFVSVIGMDNNSCFAVFSLNRVRNTCCGYAPNIVFIEKENLSEKTLNELLKSVVPIIDDLKNSKLFITKIKK